MRVEGYTRWRKGVAVFAAVLLGVTAFLYFCISVSLGAPYFTRTLTPTPTLARRAVLHQPPRVRVPAFRVLDAQRPLPLP